MPQLLDGIIADDSISEMKKVKIIEQIGIADHALTDGADEKIQLIAIVSVLQQELQRA
jgi:DNA polymerase III delta prime subunit